MKTSKKINAGDTLTVGDLTDDHLGAVIEVGPTPDGITYRFRLDRTERYGTSMVKMLTAEGGARYAYLDKCVKVITPPPVVQPDEPKIIGQCIRIEGEDKLWGVVTDKGSTMRSIMIRDGLWSSWADAVRDAGDRRIIVSDPPRWPGETPEVPERIEVGEWPDDDTHLRDYKWIDDAGYRWWRDTQAGLWRSEYMRSDMRRPLCGPWTRGERVEV